MDVRQEVEVTQPEKEMNRSVKRGNILLKKAGPARRFKSRHIVVKKGTITYYAEDNVRNSRYFSSEISLEFFFLVDISDGKRCNRRKE